MYTVGMPLKLSIADLKKRIVQLEKDKMMYRTLYFNTFHNNKRDKKKKGRMLKQIQFQLIENSQLKKELENCREIIDEYIVIHR